MRILLINPYIPKHSLYGQLHKSAGELPPLGLAYIAAILEKAGHHVSILDANVSAMPDVKIIRQVKKIKPEIIGLTATTLSYYRTRDLARLLKQELPEIPLVLGGPHVSGMGSLDLIHDGFDFGVIGEGELTMQRLVEAISGKGVAEDIKGLIYQKEGKVCIHPEQATIQNLDDLPFPARHLLPDLRLYTPKAISYQKLPSTHIFTSRGCPFRCIFCQTSFGKKVRFHSPEYVVTEIEQLKRDYGIQDIIINDDTFIIDRERVCRICELILKRNLKISWLCNIRADMIDRELLMIMKRSGCWAVALGLESGSQKILDVLRKGTTVEQGIQACHYAYETGLSVRPSFIIGNPLETFETIEETIKLAMKLPVHYPSFALMTPFPGTEIWKRASEFGRFESDDFSKLSLSSHASFVPYGLTAEFLEMKIMEAYRRVYLRPVMFFRHLAKLKGFADIKKMITAGFGLLH